jgi:hypothetical protein
MPFFATPGVAQLVIAGQFGNTETIVNVLHVQRKNDGLLDPWNAASLRQANQRLALAWQRLLPRVNSNVKWLELRARDLSTEFGAVDLFGVNLQGNVVGECSPPQVSFLLQWRTGMAGRGANGRSYIPGVGEAYVDSMGRITAAEVTTWDGIAAGILADLAAPSSATLPGAPLDLVVAHGPRGAAATGTASPILLGRLSTVVATQRRRLPKRA